MFGQRSGVLRPLRLKSLSQSDCDSYPAVSDAHCCTARASVVSVQTRRGLCSQEMTEARPGGAANGDRNRPGRGMQVDTETTDLKIRARRARRTGSAAAAACSTSRDDPQLPGRRLQTVDVRAAARLAISRTKAAAGRLLGTAQDRALLNGVGRRKCLAAGTAGRRSEHVRPLEFASPNARESARCSQSSRSPPLQAGQRWGARSRSRRRAKPAAYLHPGRLAADPRGDVDRDDVRPAIRNKGDHVDDRQLGRALDRS